MPRIVYSHHYNIGFYGLERLHPFDSHKYGRAWRLLRRHFGSQLRRFHIPPGRQASREELLLVHTAEYLSQLRDSKYVARALEIPQLTHLPGWAIDWHVLRPMRWATRGTIVAAQEALAHGFAVNLSGGYHHAKPNRGEGEAKQRRRRSQTEAKGSPSTRTLGLPSPAYATTNSLLRLTASFMSIPTLIRATASATRL